MKQWPLIERMRMRSFLFTSFSWLYISILNLNHFSSLCLVSNPARLSRWGETFHLHSLCCVVTWCTPFWLNAFTSGPTSDVSYPGICGAWVFKATPWVVNTRVNKQIMSYSIRESLSPHRSPLCGNLYPLRINVHLRKVFLYTIASQIDHVAQPQRSSHLCQLISLSKVLRFTS